MIDRNPDGRTTSSVWDIGPVVEELRQLRERSLVARRRTERPVKLPSRKSLASIVQNFSTALFPNRLGSREVGASCIDYFVGQMLDTTLSALVDELQREILFSAEIDKSADSRQRAVQVVNEFAKRLPSIRELLETDIQATYHGDPAAKTLDEVLVCYPGITAIMHHRFAHALYDLGMPLVARIIAEVAHSATGIDIHPGATIQESLFIDHGTGVVIGETTMIGARVRLHQAVTLGAKSQIDKDVQTAPGGARHPIVDDDVVIYAGATILGRVTIGRGSIIGGNVWITHSVPANSIITQAKARDEVHDGGSGI